MTEPFYDRTRIFEDEITPPGVSADTLNEYETAHQEASDRVVALEAAAAQWLFGPLPHVTITTTSGLDPTTTETYLDAAITINGPDPFSGTTQIRGRGNTSWTESAKKPWRLQLTTAASLLGIPSERSYVLLANALDPVMVRGAVAFEMGARCAGLAWTPRMRFVELTMNGTYRGLYQLGEHVEIGANKIAVVKASGTTGLALTGAYTLEIDRRYVDNGDPGFTTALGVMVGMDDPDDTVPQQATYIAQWVQTFEDVLLDDGAWLDPGDGYARYIDMPSWVDWYLINELCATKDANEFSSIKLYKTRDTADTPGTLHLGPLWDFDRSLGNDSGPATGPWVTEPMNDPAVNPGFRWIARMLDDPAFFAAVTDRWTALRTALITGDSIFAYVDRVTDRLARATGRDQRTWGSTADLLDDADDMKAWLRTRIAWLNTRWVIDTEAPSVPTGLVATPGDEQVSLSWANATDNVAVSGYRVYLDGVPVAEPMGTNYTATGLANGTTYSFTVSALDLAGNESAQSAPVVATPAEADPGGGGALTPDQIPNLHAWWKADTITGAADGDTLSTWPDSSGHGRDAVFNNDASTKPSYATAQVNSLPVVRFANGRFFMTSASSSLTAVTILAVVRPTISGGGHDIYGGGAYDGLSFSLVDGHITWRLMGDLTIGAGAGSVGTVGFSVVAGSFSAAGSWTTYLNGAEDGSGVTTYTPLAGLNAVLGNSGQYGDNSLLGDIAALVVYDAVLSEQHRAAVTAQLGDEYGITVT